MWRFVVAFAPLVACVRAEGDCTLVGVNSDTFSATLNATTTGYAKNGTGYVLQAVPFGDGRRRRTLSAQKGEGLGLAGGVSAGLERVRALTDEEPCPNKMWVLVDMEDLDGGFPYYASFDCAEDPDDINSTWLQVSSDGYAVANGVDLTCLSTKTTSTDPSTDTGDDGEESGGFMSSTTAVVAIVVGAVALLCICMMVVWFIRKRPHGSAAFENESELAERKMMSGNLGDTGTVGDGSTVVGGTRSPAVVESTGVSMMGTGPGSTVGSGIAMTKMPPPSDSGAHGSRISFKEAHVAPMQARGHRNTAGFKSPAEPPVYDGMFPSSHGMSAHSSASAGVKDSMAAAAAAAGAAASRSSTIPQEKYSQVSVDFTDDTAPGGYHPSREVVNENDIVWSAGEDRLVRNGRRVSLPSEYGDDSAAGSEFTLNPDNVPDRAYYDTESMPASSPGGYSMYSHFTAGGHSIIPSEVEDDRFGESEESWNGEESSRQEGAQVGDSSGEARGVPRGAPPPYQGREALKTPLVQDDGAVRDNGPEAPRSPAGLAASADRSTQEGSRRTRNPQ